MTRLRPPTSSRGFSMVEVLVALVIIAVGMLGLAKIQALAYASTGVASQQSIAALQAASLASAMRANRSYWSALPAALAYSKQGGGAVFSSDAQLTGVYACKGGGADAPCKAWKIAAVDVQSWIAALNLALPNPTALINCSPFVAPATPVGCTIQVSWVEENVAMNGNAQGTTLVSRPYVLYVVP